MSKVIKIFIISIMIFIIIYITYLPYKKQQIEEYISTVDTINDKLDKEIMKSIDLDSLVRTWDIVVSTGFNQEEVYKSIIIDQLADIDEITEVLEQNKWEIFNKGSLRFQKLYVSSMNKKNIDTAIRSIEYILKETPDDTAWMKKLVDLLVQIWNYDKAEKYIKNLLKLDPSNENIKTYIYIKLQNINYYNKKEVKELHNIIGALYKKKIIAYQDYSFYNFLSLLTSEWKPNDIKLSIESAKSVFTWDRLDLLNEVNKSFSDSNLYQGTHDYYARALISLNLLQYWYFGLAKKVAQEVYAINPEYVLPIQVLSYSNFFIWDYKQSLNWLNKLKSLDKKNEEYYNLFIGVSYYWNGDYRDSLLYLAQLSNMKDLGENEYIDVLRYRFLDYKHLKDEKNMIKTIKEMRFNTLNTVDYYNFFTFLLFKCDECYKNDKSLMINLIKSCYNDLPKSQVYMCWYGKANLYYKYKKYDLSTEYYEKLSDFFQDSYIFERIGDHYSFTDKDKARVFYFKALMYSSDNEEKLNIKKKIKKMFK